MKQARVMLVEDQTLLREGLRRIVESVAVDIKVVAEAGTIGEALRTLEGTQVDLVITEIRLPDGNGLDMLAQIQFRWPQLRSLVLSAYDDPLLIERAIKVRVGGYASKNMTGEELVRAIRIILSGENYLHPRIVTRLMNGRRGPGAACLNDTELKILRLIAKGTSYRDIAGIVHSSERTIRRYCTSIFSKLGVNERAQAVAEAIRRGYLD